MVGSKSVNNFWSASEIEEVRQEIVDCREAWNAAYAACRDVPLGDVVYRKATSAWDALMLAHDKLEHLMDDNCEESNA